MKTLHDIWQHHYDGDFAAGVQLLATHNPGAVTRQILERLRLLASGGGYIGEYERGKLAYALHSSAIPVEHAAPEPAPQPAAAKKSAPPPPVAPDGKLSSEKAITLHKLHSHVHALMVDAKTDEERARYAADIMERIIPALDAEYDRLRAAQSAQVSPPLEESEEATGPILNAGDARAFKKLQSIRSRISTLRKKISKENDPKRRLKLESELETKIAEKERLEAELS